jgi:hypothetical protein
MKIFWLILGGLTAVGLGVGLTVSHSPKQIQSTPVVSGEIAINDKPAMSPITSITLVEHDPYQTDDDIGVIDDASSIDKKTGNWRGLCQKESIKTVDDFKKTVINDPKLSRHYATFSFNNATIKELKEPLTANVSHKNGDIIKRTKKPIVLPKGDRYITDGVTKARIYCCNDFDFNELPPTGAGFPKPPPVFDVPPEIVVPPIVESPPHESYYVTPNTIGGHRHYYHDDRKPPPPTPAPVPEPETMVLFGTGIIGIALMYRNKQRKNGQK